MTTNLLHTIVLRSKLLEVLGVVEKSVGGEHTSLPILKHVLLRAQNEKLTLTTTDLELVIEYSLLCKVVREGSFTVPFQVFYNIVKNLSSERITLEQIAGSIDSPQHQTLHIITENYEANIHGQASDDFPIIPVLSEVRGEITLPFSVFLEAMSQTSQATLYSDIRPEISGIHIQICDGELAFAATDSFRLAERIIAVNSFTSSSRDVSLTIPIRTVSTMPKLLFEASTGEDGEIRISYDSTQILFLVPRGRVISRLVAGVFPDYRQIIPSGFKSEAFLDRLEFLNAVRTVSSLSGKGNDVLLEASGGKKFLEIKSSQGALGENVYKMPANIEGEGFELTFNWKYLLDGLKTFKGPEISLAIAGNDKPAMLRSKGEHRLLYVVMPIRG